MINRRYFLTLCAVSGSSLLVAASDKAKIPLPQEILPVIAAVQQHMFPGASGIPSANAFKAIEYLAQTVAHPTYDKDLRNLIIKGSKKLQEEEQHFLEYNEKQREKALRIYEESSLGRRWLNCIMIVTMEALLSDPIYGGNPKSMGWQSLGTSGGDPRPLKRYIEL